MNAVCIPLELSALTMFILHIVCVYTRHVNNTRVPGYPTSDVGVLIHLAGYPSAM